MASSFSTPVEYFGQSASTVLTLKSSELGKTSKTKEAADAHGDIVAREVYGEVCAPSADYEVKAAGNLALILGTVNTVDNQKICVTALSVTSKAGSAPAIKISGESLQAAATATRLATLGNIALSPRHSAQILAAAFTLTGDDCELNECSLEAKAELKRSTVNGDTIAHDIQATKIVVKATVLQLGATAPTFAAAEGWTQTAPATSSNPDEDYVVWTAEFTKDIAAAEAQA